MKSEIDMGDVMRRVTVHIKVIQRPSFRFRFWMGKNLLIFAVKIMGCNVEFHDIGEELTPQSFRDEG